jgi:tetratricopeptide (TPR) repeat protein
MMRLSTLLVLALFAALAGAQGLVPLTSPKYKATKKVYDRLVRASGSAKPAPRLVMTAGMPEGRNPGLLALYNGDTVQFSEHVYDKCVTPAGPDDDCLSVLLGHELAHFYEDHLWKQGANALGALSDAWIAGQTAATPEQIKQAAERNALESQADYAGGMLAFQAGFDPTAHAVSLLKAIYEEFQIADKEKGLPADAHPYPELETRIRIAETTARRLHDELYPVFETAIQLFLTGGYQHSAQCFDFIGKTFTSREILNNAAAAYIMQALADEPELAKGYSYPVQIDFDTRLSPSAKAKGDVDWLDEAETRLENAMRLDPGYPPAVLNMGIVKSLLKADAEAAVLADRAYALAQPSHHPEWLPQAAVLRGIVAARLGEKDKALAAFQEAAKLGNHSAGLNQKILAGETGAGESKAPPANRGAAEQIAHLTPVPPEKPNSFTSNIFLRQRSAVESSLELRLYSGEGWSARAIVEDGRKFDAFLLSTAPGYTGLSARNIPIGSNFNDLMHAYGNPSRIYPARQGTYCLYTDSNLLVFVDNNGKVAGWTIY